MQISVFAIRYISGQWKEYEHICSPEEVESVIDSAKAKAFEQFRYPNPQYADYLEGARHVFDVVRGLPNAPAEGDIQVVGVLME